MNLEKANQEAAWILSKFSYLCEKVLVVGSIRRQRPEVHDIDVVVIPKVPRDHNWNEIAGALKHAHGMAQVKKGPKLMTFIHYPDLAWPRRDPDYTVDIYNATPETWGILVLVRTGSKEHNVKLCSLALSKGMKLSASDGLLKPIPGVNTFVEVIATKSEEDIFKGLGLPYIEPKDREV